jgi:hypothetical protein
VITPTSVNKAAKRSADSKGKPGTQNVSTGSGTAAPQNATPGTSPSTPGSSSFTNAGFHGMSGMALLGLALVAAGGAALVLSRRSANIHINNIDAPQ